MDRQVVFKTSAFGGFEKKAVLDYIYRLNEESSAMYTQLREQAESLGASRDMLGENLRQANERLIILQRELDSVKGELSKERLRGVELSSMNEGLQNELARQSEQLAELREEIEQMTDEKDQLTDRNRVLQSKQAEVDQAVSSVGKLLLDARSDATEMVSKAKHEAERLLAEAREEAGRVVAEAEESAASGWEDAQRKAQEAVSGARREADALLEEAKSKSELLQMEADLAREEAVGHFRAYAHQTAQLREAAAAMLRDYNEKTEELSRLIELSGNVFERTVEVIESPDFSDPPEPEETTPEESEPDDNFFRLAAERR